MPHFSVDPDISVAQTISKEFYCSESVFQLSKEKLFSPSWQFIGHSDMVPKPGDIHPFTLLEHFLDEPLILTRDRENTLHCISNVCTHRGNIIANRPCRLTNLRCSYHGRLFHLDGQFMSMPEFKEVKNFPTKEDNLPSLPLFQWGKLLFSSLNHGIGHELYFKEMMDRLSWLPLGDFIYQPELSRDYAVKAHWALYCENYLEGFHIPFLHAELNAVIDFSNYTTELYRYSNLQLGIAKEDEDCFELPPGSPDFGKKVAAYYFFVFPNMMFNFYPWGLSLNVVMPVSLNETRISFLTFLWKEDIYDTGAGSGLDTVEKEDEEVVQNVQKGIRSRFYEHGRYSVTREQGTHHFHQIISEFM